MRPTGTGGGPLSAEAWERFRVVRVFRADEVRESGRGFSPSSMASL